MANYDAILHLDSSDPERLRLVLRNAANYLNALPDKKFNLEIVANGGGALLLTNKNDALHELALPVLKRGVKLKICANAMAEHGLEKNEIWPETIVVPAGLVEVVKLQEAGYAYIKP